MPIQRSHSRRRRVFLEESVHSELSESRTVASESASRRSEKSTPMYSDAGKREGQLKTTDLLPISATGLGTVIAVCALIICALNYLAVSAPHWSAVLSSDAIRTISFSGNGSVSAWFSSFLLLMTSMASLQIYSMRRHRNDDYGGTYRVWLWLALVFVIASINCVVDFSSVIQSLAIAAGYPSNGSLLLPLAIKFVALSIIFVRGILEIRQSRGATIAVVLAWIAYTSALVAQYPAEQFGLTQNKDLAVGNSLLIGNLSCFAMSLLFARFIFLEANGLINKPALSAADPSARHQSKATSIRRSKAVADGETQEKSKTETRNKSETNLKTEPQESAEPPPLRVSRANSAPPLPAADNSHSETRPESNPGKGDMEEEEQEILSLQDRQDLSKSERRRLKKLQKRQRRAA